MVRSVRPFRWLGPILLVLGVLALAYGLIQGQGTLSLVLVFPVITATGGWTALGIVLVLAGFLVSFLAWTVPPPAMREGIAEPPAAGSPPAAPSRSRRWGGVVFLGPLPIVFGSDAKIARWMLLAAVALFAALIVLFLFALWGL